MCKRIPGSGVKRIIVYTVEQPYGKGTPGYVAASNKLGTTGELEFTSDLWYAMTFANRKDLDTAMPGLRSRTRKELYTHEAIAQLSTPE